MADIGLFSYGTLQDPKVQQANFGRLLEGSPDRLPGYETGWVQITDPEVIAESGLDRHPIVRPSTAPDAGVDGTLFFITQAELAAADVYEAEDYRRVEVALASGAVAWVYIAA
jgi:hypothetical protein